MKKLVSSVVLIATAVSFGGCTFHRAHFEYPEFENKMIIQSTSVLGAERLGPIRTGEGGAIWVSCTSAATGSIWNLVDEARNMGGNAIGDIRWIPQNPDRSSENPTCKKKWGWFLLWPVLLTPGFMSSRVEAVAYRLPDDSDTTAGIYRIPADDADRHALADRIVIETGFSGTRDTRSR